MKCEMCQRILTQEDADMGEVLVEEDNGMTLCEECAMGLIEDRNAEQSSTWEPIIVETN